MLHCAHAMIAGLQLPASVPFLAALSIKEMRSKWTHTCISVMTLRREDFIHTCPDRIM